MRTMHAATVPIRRLLTGLLLQAAVLTGAAHACPPGDPVRDGLADAFLETVAESAEGAVSLPAGGRDLFTTVLSQPLFQHAACGPFDVYVCQADGLRKANDAKKVLQRACEGLEPLAKLIEREFPGSEQGGSVRGLMTGRRFTVVLTSARANKKEASFDQIVALLDRCEDGAFSGYKPDLPVWNETKRVSDTVTTWEVAVFNIAHQAVVSQDKAWFDHGLGYSVGMMLGSRMLYRGAFGPVPPWLLQGLADDLDIEAYGDAWVAAGESSSWSSVTAGWHNAGWEGFVPIGGHPPPPIMGPPPGNRTKSFEGKTSSDAWIERSNSTSRHWSELVADLRSEQPVSLALMAGGQTFTSRDRAWSRCVLHLLLDIARPDAPGSAGATVATGAHAGLLRSLDREAQRARSGLLDGEPLPRIMARVLDTKAIDALATQDMRSFLAEIGRDDIVRRITELKAEPLLAMKDHAAEADWLYGQKFGDRERLALFNLIVEVEGYRELREWELLGIRLDDATRAALATTKSYPLDAKSRATAAAAFRGALASDADDAGG